MDAKLLNPFIQAAVDVLKAEVEATVSRGEISLQKSSLTSDDITVLINLVGDVYGVVNTSFFPVAMLVLFAL